MKSKSFGTLLTGLLIGGAATMLIKTDKTDRLKGLISKNVHHWVSKAKAKPISDDVHREQFI